MIHNVLKMGKSKKQNNPRKKKKKKPKDPSVDEYVNKMWYKYKREYYSVIKRIEILIQAKTWMNLKDNMLNEISQIQKDKHGMIPLNKKYLE